MPQRRSSRHPTPNYVGAEQHRLEHGTTTPGIADNFQTFLTLLTTQLQNQNPLDPLDTNQFTQQLVQFAGVEQQMKANDQLTSLVAHREDRAVDPGAGLVGQTVAVDGSTAQFDELGDLEFQRADKTPTPPSPSPIRPARPPIAAPSRWPGNASFVWDGKGNDGTQWPRRQLQDDGHRQGPIGNNVAISTEIQGVVDSVDLTASPPLLSIGGQNYTTDQIKRVGARRTTTATTGS